METTAKLVNAQAYLALHGAPSHVDGGGRLWATVTWTQWIDDVGLYVGQTSEAIEPTYSAVRDWLGY